MNMKYHEYVIRLRAMCINIDLHVNQTAHCDTALRAGII